MRWQQVDPGPGIGAAYVVVLDPDEEAVGALTGFAREHDVGAAQVTGVGGFASAVVGWFDRQARDYRRVRLDQQCEVLSLVGDIAVAGGLPALHVHAVLGLPDATTRGGHLLEGRVWPTLEVVIRDSPVTLRKRSRPDVGLALIELPHAGP